MQGRGRSLATIGVALALLVLVVVPVGAIYDPPTRLSGVVPDHPHQIHSVEVSPDGRWAVFIADLAVNDRFDLWSVPLDGTVDPTPIRLSSGPGDVGRFVVTPDSSRVVYRGNLGNVMPPSGEPRFDLYSAPIDTTGEQVLLNGPHSLDSDVLFSFTVTPDGTRVVYGGDLDDDGVIELYSAPTDRAGGQVRLNNPPLEPGGDVSSFTVTPDSARVVYRGDLLVDGTFEVFSAPIDREGGQIRLSSDPLDGSGPLGGELLVAPDSSRVVYRGEFDQVGVIELYSAPLDNAGEQLRLNTTPTSGGDVGAPRLAPDGSRVVYTGDLNADGVIELYSAPIDTAGGQVRLNSTPSGVGRVPIAFEITPDSARVVYRGKLASDTFEVYSAPIDRPGGQVKLSADPVEGGTAEFVQSCLHITPDSSRVVYTGKLDRSTVRGVYSAPVDQAGQQVRLSDDPVEGRDVAIDPDDTGCGLDLTPDGAHAVYIGDLTTDGIIDLYSAPIDGSVPQVRLSERQDPNGGVEDIRDEPQFRVTADSSRVVYRGNLDDSQVLELYSAPVGTGGAQTKLNDAPAKGHRVFGFDVARDSSFVVYRVGDAASGNAGLFASGRGQLPAPPPTGVTAADVGTTTATVSWTAPPATSQVTGFEVTTTAGSAGGSAFGVGTVEVTGTRVTLDGLDPATTYTVEVRTINDAGLSEPSRDGFTTASGPDPDPSPEPAGVVRLFGADRFATAAAVALDRFDPAGVDTVYLATGRDFPDALAGGPLATADGAPILLATADGVPEVTADALEVLAPSRVVALGGTAVLPDAVLGDAAAAAGGAATGRLAGADRFATAAEIATTLVSSPEVVYLATGRDFPDALAGGPLAAADGAPILLATAEVLPEATAAALVDLAPATVLALGGTAVLPDQVLAAAAAAAGGAVTDRLAGVDRFATAAEIAGAVPGAVETVYVATGRDFPDALTGVPAAANEGAPILLATPDALPDPTAAHLGGLADLRRIVILGGTAAIGESVETDLAGHLP